VFRNDPFGEARGTRLDPRNVERGMRLLRLSVLAVVASVLTACGATSRSVPAAASERPGHTVWSAAVALLFPRTSRVVLSIPHAGRLYARCDRHGDATTQVRVAFVERSALTTVETSGRHVRTTLQPTLVAPKPPGGAGTQVWQVGPISEGQKPLTTIWVGVSHYPPNRGCVVSAHGSTTIDGTG
jgi:hypothetical protein